jgi:thioredoxin 1
MNNRGWIQKETTMALTHTTDDAFTRDVLHSTLPVLVDFTAAWCPPCVMIAPVLERIAADESARLRVVSVDVDENPIVTARYQILGMPTLALFVDGEIVARFMGAKPRAAIMAQLEPHLAPIRRAVTRTA